MKTKKEELKFGILVHRKLSKKDLSVLKEHIVGWNVYNMVVGISKIPTEVALLVPPLSIDKNSIHMTSEIKSYIKDFNKIDNCTIVFYDIKQLFKVHTPKLDLFLVPKDTNYFRFPRKLDRMKVQMSHGEDGNTFELKTNVNIS